MPDQNNLPDLSREEQQDLLDLATEQADQIDQLQQKLESQLSINSELEQELQKALEKNEKLNNSDLLLRKAEKLNQSAQEVKTSASKAVDEANRRAEYAEAERDRALKQSSRDRAAAAEERRSAERYKAEQEQLKRDELKLIDQSAEEKIKAEKARLQRDNELSKDKTEKHYKAEYAAKETQHFAMFLFCTVWCVIQAVFTPKVIEDISQVISWIAKYAVSAWGWILSWSDGAASITNGISNTTAATVLYWVVGVLVGTILGILLYVVVMVGPIYVSWLYFASKRFDLYNKRFMAYTGVLWIVASYAMPGLPVNLFLIWIGLQLLTAILKGIEAWYGDKDYWEKEKIWNFVREKILPPVIIVGGGIGTILFVAWINGRL